MLAQGQEYRNLRYVLKTSRIRSAKCNLSCAAAWIFALFSSRLFSWSFCRTSPSPNSDVSEVACRYKRSQLCALICKSRNLLLSSSNLSCSASSSANSLSRYNRFLADSLSNLRKMVVDLSSSEAINAEYLGYPMRCFVQGRF